MKLVVYLICIACLFSGCERQNPTLLNPTKAINFKIEKVNSNNNYVSTTKQFSFKGKTERWSLNSINELKYLSRDIKFDVELENEDTVVLEFGFNKRVDIDKNDLILAKPNNVGDSGEAWHFKDFEQEFDDFYNQDLNLRIRINGAIFFTTINSEDVQLLSLEKGKVNGEVYAEFKFKGEVFSIYDPKHEYVGYILTNGYFKGVIN